MYFNRRLMIDVDFPLKGKAELEANKSHICCLKISKNRLIKKENRELKTSLDNSELKQSEYSHIFRSSRTNLENVFFIEAGSHSYTFWGWDEQSTEHAQWCQTVPFIGAAANLQLQLPSGSVYITDKVFICWLLMIIFNYSNYLF